MPAISAAKIVVLLLCFSLIAIDGFRSWSAYSNRLQESEATLSNLARSLSQHAEDVFTEADTVLFSLVERLEVDGVHPNHLKRLNSVLKSQAAELPQLHGLFVYDENGRWLANSLNVFPRKVNNSDREYFVYHRTHAYKGPIISSPVQSRSTGEWILTLSRRYNRPDGSFAGVVLATIHMSYFNKFYNSFDIGKQGAIMLALTNGTLLVHRPYKEDVIGKSMQGLTLFSSHVPNAPSGMFTADKENEGQKSRMTAYRVLNRYPMVVAVSSNKDELFAAWRANAWQNLAVAGILAVLLAIMGLRLVHHIELQLRTEGQLLQAQEKLQSLNRHLEKIALQDGLTGLANRRQFDTALSNEFRRARRSSGNLTLLMIDVDFFKQYNDLYGHPAGDECLKTISEVVQSCQHRPGDLSARYGGEEIAVLLPDTDVAGGIAVAEKIRSKILDLGIPHRGSAIGAVTISCGVASINPHRDDNDPMVLVNTADQALYKAKANGRNLVHSDAMISTIAEVEAS